MRSLIKGPWLQGRDYHGRREDADGGGERKRREGATQEIKPQHETN
jgi:hypothetical protein